jgi:protoporphyrinogen/coproporphyrinogen III oxidase
VRVAVIGGGIAGLAAAHRLSQLVPGSAPWELPLLVEEEPTVGGKIRTEHTAGFVIEAAPDSFLSRKERGIGLCEELGLGGDLVGRRPEHAQTFVRRGDELHLLPEGLTGMVPTNLEALERGSLLSVEGVQRFRREPEVPVAPGGDDESIASFVSRRFGREAYEALVEPLMTGMYGGDGERMSTRAVFPQLRELELAHGSVLRGLSDTPTAPSGSYPPFVSLASGMDVLVRALARRLENQVQSVVGQAAVRLRRRRPGGYELELDDGSRVDLDAVVLAVPAFAAAPLLDELDEELAELHREIPYASSVVVSLAFARTEVVPLDGYGYLVPRIEGSNVLACTWSSQKWERRAPDEFVLVRVYAGRYGERDLSAEDDETLVGLARDELRHLGVVADPTLVRVHRWPLGMPQYVLGHPERVDAIDRVLEKHPGVALAGAAYRGVGIPDCIASGEAAAESVAHTLVGTPV